MNQEEPPGALTLIRLLSESRRTAPVQSKAVLGVRIHQKLHKSNIDTWNGGTKTNYKSWTARGSLRFTATILLSIE